MPGYSFPFRRSNFRAICLWPKICLEFRYTTWTYEICPVSFDKMQISKKYLKIDQDEIWCSEIGIIIFLDRILPRYFNEGRYPNLIFYLNLLFLQFWTNLPLKQLLGSMILVNLDVILDLYYLCHLRCML